MTSCTGSVRGGFGGDLKKVSWVLPREKTVDSRLLAEALCRVRTWCGADRKVIIERLCISLPYVETFNSKVIKGFVPELRSRYVFFVFRDSYVLCIYVMNILCTFHISVSWGLYTSSWSSHRITFALYRNVFTLITNMHVLRHLQMYFSTTINQ